MTEILLDGGDKAPRPSAIVKDGNSHAQVIPVLDDGSSGPIEVGFPLLFGRFYTHLFINTNGSVTFGEPLYKYIPAGLKVKSGLPPIIAPFLADVDPRAAGSGRIGYGTVTFDGRKALCVNWISVGYHRERTDKLNSFQLLLVDRGDAGLGDFDIVMNYDRLEWESGISTGGKDGLGGRTAAAGLTMGTGAPYTSFEFPTSRTPGALLDTHTGGLSNTSTNSSVIGRHIFRIRRGRIEQPFLVEEKNRLLMPHVVLLNDGRVLALGEFNPFAFVFTASKGKDTWTSTPPTHKNRRRHTATLLKDGQVLVTGGEDEPTSEELFDPTKNTWTDLPGLSTGRLKHTATLLGDGRVLVIGGQMKEYDYATRHASAELFDPGSKKWSPVEKPMSTTRGAHTATLLSTGKVLVTGGEARPAGASSTTVLASAELFDPATNTWTSAGNMAIPRAEHTATPLPDGKVLVAGGETDAEASDKMGLTELYDPKTNTWTVTGRMKSPRRNPTATALKSGHVIVTGGEHAYTGYQEAVELYDPVTKTWSNLVPMYTKRKYHAATQLRDGRLLIVGGITSPADFQGTYELYYPPFLRG